MPKRSRISSVELISVDGDGFVIEANKKEYYVFGNEYTKYFGNPDLEINVIHNFEHRAMLDIENIRSGQIVHRQEINPIKFKDVDDWVQDD